MAIRFYEAAAAAKEPKGKYASAREMLDDLPAIIKQCYGPDGVTIASHMLARRKGQWRRSEREWFDRMIAFAGRALQNQDLAPEVRASWEVMAVIGWVVDAAEKQLAL